MADLAGLAAGAVAQGTVVLPADRRIFQEHAGLGPHLLRRGEGVVVDDVRDGGASVHGADGAQQVVLQQ